jgi:hypothetical protein
MSGRLELVSIAIDFTPVQAAANRIEVYFHRTITFCNTFNEFIFGSGLDHTKVIKVDIRPDLVICSCQ